MSDVRFLFAHNGGQDWSDWPPTTDPAEHQSRQILTTGIRYYQPMSTYNLSLPSLLHSGYECERCIVHLCERLEHIEGVVGAIVAGPEATLRIEYKPERVSRGHLEQAVHRIGADLEREREHQTMRLHDLHCPDCALIIQKAVRKVPGVVWAEVRFTTMQMFVEFERHAVSLEQIGRVVADYDVRACLPDQKEPNQKAAEGTGEHATRQAWWRRQRRQALTGAAAVLTLAGLALSATPAAPFASWLYAAAILTGGVTIARHAVAVAHARSVDMNILVTLAVLGAVGLGDRAEGAAVVVLFNIGNLLQAGAMERTRRSLRSLMHLRPKTAWVQRGSEEADAIELPVEQIVVGDVVQIRPGERIPADGVVLVGRSAIDQAPITGESIPVERGPGEIVYAGSLNGSGAISLRVTHAYQETMLARIVHCVEEAQAQRAPAQEFIDRFARYYTPIVIGLAVLLALLPPTVVQLGRGLHGLPVPADLWQTWLSRALAALLVSCPCALVISTPVAIVTAVGSAARNGALIKGGACLEALGKMRALLYDKTGTLTEGHCRIEAIVPLTERSAPELLRIGAALEAHSTHPLAIAFLTGAKAQGDLLLPYVRGLKEIPGHGVEGILGGRTYRIGGARLLEVGHRNQEQARHAVEQAMERGQITVLLADTECVLGLFTLRDSPRPKAATTIEALRTLGIRRQAMLTGDHAQVAQAVAAAVGLNEVQAGLLPEQKLSHVRQYQQECGVVGMVGDGINDAPALAAADVGIVMGAAGSDIAMETADVVLMRDDLARLPYLIRLSRRTRTIMRQNVAFSLLTKGLLLTTAVVSGVPLWLAVLGDVGVSLIVTLNALRLHDNAKA